MLGKVYDFLSGFCLPSIIWLPSVSRQTFYLATKHSAKTLFAECSTSTHVKNEFSSGVAANRTYVASCQLKMGLDWPRG